MYELEALTHAEVRFQVRFLQAGQLPPFRGATLRGALGFALRKAICHHTRGSCQDCPVVNSCAYSCLFEGVAPPGRTIMRKYKHIPQPFVLLCQQEDPCEVAVGDTYEFGMRLFGAGINHLPYVGLAFIQAGQRGLGRDRIPFEVMSIRQVLPNGDRVLYDGNESAILPPEPQTFMSPAPDGSLRALVLQFDTPARFRFEGRTCLRPDFGPIFKAIHRRVLIMAHFYGRGADHDSGPDPLFDQAFAVRLAEDRTRPFQFERYSNRQQQRMRLEGLLGSVRYEGELAAFGPFLRAAALTHIGKATSFGFGRITVHENESV